MILWFCIGSSFSSKSFRMIPLHSVSLPATLIFIKRANYWRTDFPFAFSLSDRFQSGLSLHANTLIQTVNVPPYISMLLPSLSWLSLTTQLCLSAFMNFPFFHSCVLTTLLAAAASEVVYHVGNLEMFPFFLDLSFRIKILSFLFHWVTLWSHNFGCLCNIESP